jgi:hypothetical protein
MWEILERVGVVIMIIGFMSLGVLGWASRSQSQELLRRLGVVEQRLDSVIKIPRIGEGFDLSGRSDPSPSDPSVCNKDCVRSLVSEAIATMSGISGTTKKEVVERVVERVSTPVQTSTGPKSYYVPIGAGETTSTSWVDLPGAEITFNLVDFGNVKQVFFEAQLQSSAGLVKARLWDKAGGGMVAGSEISHVAGDAKLISSPVTIPSGGRTIGVQLASEVQQPVKLLSSRLRIDVR